jgi:hypothetical protein
MQIDSIDVSETAAKKATRYLTAAQLRRVLRTETGYVCTRTSPNHDDLYADDTFIMRGDFCGQSLDIVFAVEGESLVVITQTSQHADSLRGRFYQYVGDSAADALEYVDGRA